MEKSYDMDFDDWELLPDTQLAFSDFSLESENNLLFCQDIDVNYFSNEKNSSSMVISEKDEDDAALQWKDIGVVPQARDDHRDVVSLVVFKKMKDDEFVDMKVESPKTSSTKSLIMAQLEPEQILFDCQDDKESEKEIESVEPEIVENHHNGCEVPVRHKIWRWGLLAAATICIFVLGGSQTRNHQHKQQKIQFQIYSDEKRIKQVFQQATRLNQAFSSMRGAPMTTAHISFGGYYDGL